VIECNSDNGVNIAASVVEDSYLDKAKLYRLFLSPYRISQLKSSDPSVDVSRIIMKEVIPDPNAGDVKFNISSSDVDANTVYYGFILPIDSYD
jgi:hypothetical protein